MQETNTNSQNATDRPVSNVKVRPVRWHSLRNKNAHSPVYDSLRAYRRNTAAYWLNTARDSCRSAKQMKGSGKDLFMRFAMAEMMLYAKWKARAERAEW